MKYRPEIDGLRAIAVLPVILFHAGYTSFSGGYVGVDIFFVISGYLITSIIFGDIQAGSYSITKFYERRARRILPALFLMMLISTIAAMLFIPPLGAKNYFQSVVAVALFSSNIQFYRELSDYFGMGAEYMPLLHTWTLAVEEQFYIIYPLFLMIIWKFGKSWVFWILTIIAFISLALANWGSLYFPGASFYLIPTRAWELLLGCLIAIQFRINGRPEWNATLRQLFSFVGVLLIFYAVFMFNSNTPFPSFFTLAPTVGAALIIIFATPITFIGKVLSNKILVTIGLISYSAYLYHLPLFVFTRYITCTELNHSTSLVLTIAAFLLGYISWRFVERPFRNRAFLSTKTVFFCSFAGSIFFVFIGLLGHYTNGFYDYKTSKIAEPRKWIYVDMFKERRERDAVIKQLTERDDAETVKSHHNVLILGDSMAGDFWFAVNVNKDLFKGYRFIKEGLDDLCIPDFREWLENHEKGKYAKCNRSDKFEKIYNLSLGCDEIVLTADWTKKSARSALSLASYFHSRDKRVYVIGKFRNFNISDSSYLFATSSLPINRLGNFMFDRVLSSTQEINNILRTNTAKDKGVMFIDKSKFFCDFTHKTCSLYDTQGKPLIFDGLHVTKVGASYYANALKKAGFFQ